MAMKFSIFGIVLMFLAIALGTVVGNALAGMVGFAGGIIGTLLVGFVVYVIYAFLSGMPIKVFAGVIFAIMVWLTNMIAGLIQGKIGFGGALAGYLISALILSFLWGNWGSGMAGQTTSTKTTTKKGKRKR